MRIFGRGIVKYLHFHTHIRRITLKRCPNPNAVVTSRRKFELESEDKVCVFFFGEQIATTICRTGEHTILDGITRANLTDKFPAIQGLAIEQRNKTILICMSICTYSTENTHQD